MDGFDFGDPGSDPNVGGFNLNSWTGTGGTGPGSMYVLPGEGGGERAETGLTTPFDDSAVDPISGAQVNTQPGMPGSGWGNPDTGFFSTIKDLFSGAGYGGQLGQLAAFGGVAALLNKMAGQQSQQPVGYQGGIPDYTATRQQTPLAQQRPTNYRPGQGGITYFTPVQYIRQPTPAAPPPVVGGGTTVGDSGGTTVGDSGGVTEPGDQSGGVASLLTPAQFKNYMYQGGANDATATQRGINYIKQNKLGAQDALSLWNSALGTKFTLDDYNRIMGITPTTTTVVSPKTDTTPDTTTDTTAGTDTSGMTPEKFKQLIYAGNADDATATQRGIDYVRKAGLSPENAVDLWNKALGTKFTTDDYFRVMPITTMPVDPTGGTPEGFKEYIYSGGADDAEATRRGIEYVKKAGLAPQDALNLWNKSLGTKFDLEDYKRVMGIPSVQTDTESQTKIPEKTVAPTTVESPKPEIVEKKISSGPDTDPDPENWGNYKLTPEQFKKYLYAGAQDQRISDEEATRRGLEYVQRMGMAPQEAVDFWNKALGTKFTVDDYNRVTKKTTQPVVDRAVAVASGGYMPGGIAMLAGGRYLRGPGDGVSDSIPAKFERSGQPARLADGEFVIDARTVSEIGNGSSEAGARKLYAMMDRVHAARKKAQRGKPSGADKFLPK